MRKKPVPDANFKKAQKRSVPNLKKKTKSKSPLELEIGLLEDLALLLAQTMNSDVVMEAAARDRKRILRRLDRLHFQVSRRRHLLYLAERGKS